jgi:hypothetical protein
MHAKRFYFQFRDGTKFVTFKKVKQKKRFIHLEIRRNFETKPNE